MNLPETWRLVRLSAICEINPPPFRDEKPSPDTLVSFVPMAAVDEVEGKITRPETRALRDVSKGFTPFRENDVLFAKITPSMENGKAAIATGLQNGVGFGSTEFHVLRPTEHLLPDYLFYFIRQPGFRERASAAFVGSAGQQRVPQDFLERVLLLLPSFPEQQRVVAILRQADELHRLRREILEQVHKLPLALFIETFGDPISNPKNYRKVALGRLGQLDRGVSKHRPTDVAFLYGGDYPFVQTGDVTNSGGWITSHAQTYSEAGLAQSRLWPEGTLCITIAANIARTGILTFAACFPDSVVGFLPGPEVTTEYVMYAIRLLQHRLEAQAPQAAQKISTYRY
jgi:type I restriction enzyme, S subunit